MNTRDSVRREAAAGLARALAARGIKFVLPRNFELPGELKGDLDIWVEPGDLRRAARIIREAARKFGWRLLSKWELPWHVQYAFYKEGTDLKGSPWGMAVDLESEVGRKGFRYAPLPPFLEDPVQEGPFPRLPEGASSVALALHVVLSKGELSARYGKRLGSCQLEAFSSFARRVLPSAVERKLTKWLAAGAPENEVEDLAATVRRYLIIARPTNVFRRLYVRLRAWSRFFTLREGLLVAFVGPDGGGKTTTASLVRRELPRIPNPVQTVYMGKKTAVLPTSRLIRWFSTRFGNTSLVPGPPPSDGRHNLTYAQGASRRYNSVVSRLADMVGLVNWLAEQWYRYVAKVRPILQQGGIVLTDRYFTDFAQRPDSSIAHLEPVRRVLLRLFPEPDLAILLWADSTVLRRRTSEDDGGDPEVTLGRLREVLAHYPNSVEVRTDVETARMEARSLAHKVVRMMGDRCRG